MVTSQIRTSFSFTSQIIRIQAGEVLVVEPGAVDDDGVGVDALEEGVVVGHVGDDGDVRDPVGLEVVDELLRGLPALLLLVAPHLLLDVRYLGGLPVDGLVEDFDCVLERIIWIHGRVISFEV